MNAMCQDRVTDDKKYNASNNNRNNQFILFQASTENGKLKAELDKLNKMLEDEKQKVEDLMFRNEEENINREDYNVIVICLLFRLIDLEDLFYFFWEKYRNNVLFFLFRNIKKRWR